MASVKRRTSPLLDRPAEDVFRDASSWADLVAGLRFISLGDNELVRVLVVGGHVSLSATLRERSFKGLRHLSHSGSVDVFSFRRTYGRTKRQVVKGAFAVTPSSHRDVFLIVYVGGRTFLKHGLTHLIDALYPWISRPFLTQIELHNVLRGLQRACFPDTLKIHESSARRRLGSAKRRLETIRSWTDTDLDAAFSEAGERNLWFKSVRFTIQRAGQDNGAWTGLRGEISKYGMVAFDRAAELIDRVAMPLLVHNTHERQTFLDRRDRMASPKHVARPVEISYDQPLLKKPEDIRRLLESLQRFSFGTCTVLHGNPYLHVLMVDDRDFSATDVWVLSENRILIVPQLRSSAAALKRLINHVFETFKEGKLGDAAQESA